MADLPLELDGVITTLFRMAYRRRKPCEMEAAKPRLKWFPKYRATVRVPRAVRTRDDPSEALEEILATRGFEIAHWTKEAIYFGRGKSWGDFSLKLIPLLVSLPLPITEESEMTVEVANVCFFDTGDLWQLTRELCDLVEAEAGGPAADRSEPGSKVAGQ